MKDKLEQENLKEDVKKDVKRYICIHGHFYQPYRKNPWVEKMEMQEDLFPYHDWNEKITAQCYSANGFAHILNSHNKLEEVVNNYSKISFNFGPTLLEWLKENNLKTFNRILQADMQSLKSFSNHGSAIAQTYNHLIMPLADKNDKYLQVYWAIKDFEDKFKRKPEGMWIAETAVDYETLEVLAEFNIKFTILSPDQAKGFRKIVKENEKIQNDWVEVSGGNINTRMPYLCKLPSGREIAIFFYDKEISIGVSFGDLLNNGEKFADCLINAPSYNQQKPEIVIVASDGETYGHHKKFGDMALAYCLKCIENNKKVKLTVFGEYLEKYPPDYEVKIIENTAWSCPHSLCRWKDDCGCASDEDGHPNWNQKWRAPLREAINLLRVKINEIFKKEISSHISYINIKTNLKSDSSLNTFNTEFDPVNSLALLKEYINIIKDRSDENINNFLNKFLKTEDNSYDFEVKKSKLLSLLEMQRQAMLMQSSDGWFFDDIFRIESIQILRHACRAIELAKEFSSEDLQNMILKILINAKSNINENINGATIYNKSVISAIYTPEKVAAHLISILLFNNIINDGNFYNNNLKINIININSLQDMNNSQAISNSTTNEAVKTQQKLYEEYEENLYKKITGMQDFNNDKLIYDFFGYEIRISNLKYLQKDNLKIIIGTALLKSKITLKKFLYDFAAIYNKNYFLINPEKEKILNIYIKESDNKIKTINETDFKLKDEKYNKIKNKSPNGSLNQFDNFFKKIEKLLQGKDAKDNKNWQEDKEYTQQGYTEIKNAETENAYLLYDYFKKLSGYKLYTIDDLNNETQIEIFKILPDDMLNKNAYNIVHGNNAIKNLPDFTTSPINYDFLKIDINNLNLFANKILIYNLLQKNKLNNDDIEKLLNLIKDFQYQNNQNNNYNSDFDNNYLKDFEGFNKLNLKAQDILFNILNSYLDNIENEALLTDAINSISVFNNLKISINTWQIQNILYEIQNKIIQLKNKSDIILSKNLLKDFNYLIDYFGLVNKLNS
ncbi:MAG: DUF3536 domain-containing protein [Candidatus Humimicrobiaceae bacterium]